MLTCTKTPLRVSFFGGGTDYPEYFLRKRGAVVGMAIDKYIYISVLPLLAAVQHRYKVSYSKIEAVMDILDIKHPVVREGLKKYEITSPLEIAILADLPSSSGLGSSSSFSVGFIHAITKIIGKNMTKYDLARSATHLEKEILNERVGVQDQLHAAFGGINRFDFEGTRFRVSPLQMRTDIQDELSESLVLVYTGLTRYASDTLEEQMAKTADLKLESELEGLLVLVDQCVSLLETQSTTHFLKEFGQLLHEGWQKKKNLSSKITNTAIDALYEEALRGGALGGKLCGAGGGGFLLLVVPKHLQSSLQERLGSVQIIPIGIDPLGSQLTKM